MTNAVSLLGMFTPAQGARDAKTNDDTALASFAGLLAGVNQATAKLVVPTPQADGMPDGDVLENAEDGATTSDSRSAGDSKDASTIHAVSAADTGSTAVVSVTNPNAINTSIAALNPALQEKLARVITRMRDETGHDVQVAETYRSQSRQNALYAQGRSTDGPVVTWTQHSKHTQGRAVDVIVDGGRASADTYATLQRIANEEGLRTLGAKDPGHLELPSKSTATSQALNDVISVPDEPADASGPGQMSVARLAEIASVATVDHVTNVGSGAARATKLSPTTYMKVGNSQNANVAAPARVARVAHPEQSVFAQADGVADTSGDIAAPSKAGNGRDLTIADATGASSDEDLLISNLDRLSDAVNATRVGDDSNQPQATAAGANEPRAAAFAKSRMAPRAQTVVGAHAGAGQQSRTAQTPTKSQGASGPMQLSAPSIGRSSNNSQGFSSDSQSSDRNSAGYGAMQLRGETAPQFSVTDVSTEMASTAPQRAERIMAAQDAPARPLSQIVMSVDNGNGTSDRIQVAMRGSTVNATIDAADHHAASAMRAHSDELVRSLTKDGVDVESVRVRNSATTTAAAQVTTVDSSQKSSDTSSNSRFNREAQWDQQRSQQRSNNERRQQQRHQRGEKES